MRLLVVYIIPAILWPHYNICSPELISLCLQYVTHAVWYWCARWLPLTGFVRCCDGLWLVLDKWPTWHPSAIREVAQFQYGRPRYRCSTESLCLWWIMTVDSGCGGHRCPMWYLRWNNLGEEGTMTPWNLSSFLFPRQKRVNYILEAVRSHVAVAFFDNRPDRTLYIWGASFGRDVAPF